MKKRTPDHIHRERAADSVSCHVRKRPVHPSRRVVTGGRVRCTSTKDRCAHPHRTNCNLRGLIPGSLTSEEEFAVTDLSPVLSAAPMVWRIARRVSLALLVFGSPVVEFWLRRGCGLPSTWANNLGFGASLVAAAFFFRNESKRD